MYQFLVSFTVPPQRRDDFVRAARKAARDSLANEPGSQRFEVIADEEDPNVFYLNEVYTDADAFTAHANGPYFAAFYAGRAVVPPESRGICGVIAINNANPRKRTYGS